MNSVLQINSQFPFFFPTVFFLFGACVGSFLNVCIFRIPAGKSIVRPPSHCACGKPIAWHDNIPILGWILLRGRARCCGRRISFRYPLVETLTAAVFCAAWVCLPPVQALVGMVFLSILIFCSFVDIDTMMLPDFATIGGAALGLAISAVLPDVHSARIEGAPFLASAVASCVASVCGIAVGSGILYWLRLAGEVAFGREAMGEGDVILVGMIGAFCGWQGAVFAIFAGSLIGALVMLPVLSFRALWEKSKNSGKKSGKAEPKGSPESGGEACEAGCGEIPYGPWLALGGGLYYLFFSRAVDEYFAAVANMLFG